MHTNHIILIRGAPGIGKSTIGQLLKQKLTSCAVIDVDDVRRMCNSERYLYGYNDDYESAIDAACCLASRFIDIGHGPVMIVDVFAEPFLRRAISNLSTTPFVLITLIADEVILCSRMMNRGTGYKNTNVAVQVNYAIMDSLGAVDVAIDTSALHPHQVAQAIIGAIHASG